VASRAAAVPVIMVTAAVTAAVTVAVTVAVAVAVVVVVMGTPVRMDVKTVGAAGGHGVRIIIRRRDTRYPM
jgi:hypothetical protein